MASAAAAAAATAAGTSSLSADDSVSKSTHHSMVDIEKLIELKLEMANQQATIDTLKARLHNLEITNSKLSSTLSHEQSTRIRLEKSNKELREKLQQCHEKEEELRDTIQVCKAREAELRKEVITLKPSPSQNSLVASPSVVASRRDSMEKQISTVDWGDDADEHDDDDDIDDDDVDGSNNRSSRLVVRRLHKVEREKEDLSKENARLSQELEQLRNSLSGSGMDMDMSDSNRSSRTRGQKPILCRRDSQNTRTTQNTETTEPSSSSTTKLDESDHGLGSTILNNIGSSLKNLPFTRIRRATSDLSEYANPNYAPNYFEDTIAEGAEEKSSAGLSSGTLSIDDIKNNFRDFVAESSGGETKPSRRGSILQEHLKVQRRWSAQEGADIAAVTGGNQATTTAAAIRGRTGERRGWGSWREGLENEVGKGAYDDKWGWFSWQKVTK